MKKRKKSKSIHNIHADLTMIQRQFNDTLVLEGAGAHFLSFFFFYFYYFYCLVGVFDKSKSMDGRARRMKRTASETRERNYGKMSRGTHLNAADRNPGSHPAFAASAAKWRGVHFAEKKGQSFSTTVAAAFVQSATRFPTSVPLHLAHLSLARVEKKETGWTERGNFRRWKILGEMYQPCAFPQ